MRASFIALGLVSAALGGLGAACAGNTCSGFRGSEAVCIDYGNNGGCSCSSSAPTDTCITASMFTQNGWPVPAACVPEGSGGCYNTGQGPHPCCPGLTCVAACAAGACGAPAGCQGDICMKLLSSPTPSTGQCLVEAYTCANPNVVPPAGCNNARVCCNGGSCTLCLGGDCPGNGMTWGPCTQGSCTNEQASLTNYCCSECDNSRRCPVGEACQNGKCGAPYCGEGNFVVACGNGRCPNNSNCTTQQQCQCNAPYKAVACDGTPCNGQCSPPNYWCN